MYFIYALHYVQRSVQRVRCFYRLHNFKIISNLKFFLHKLYVLFYSMLDSQLTASVNRCLILALGLRLFSPREVASLMCFPPSFHFPPETTLREAYHLLGNSVNVRVISSLMSYMLGSTNAQSSEVK